MLGVAIAAIVVLWVAYLVWKGYKPQTVIFLGGMILLAGAIIIGKPIITPKGSSGFAWFDIFKVVEDVMIKQVPSLGLMIMSVAGFARYMDYIGANEALVSVGTKPLRFISSPYVILSVAFLIGMLMKTAIISAAGLGILLMATMYPILVGLGASRAAAAAVIVTATCLDLGPASATTQFVAKTAGIETALYVSKYQMLVAIPVIIFVAVLHYFTHKWLDRREGFVPLRAKGDEPQSNYSGNAPAIYASLPFLPLVLILVFSSVTGSKIKMSVISAMLIGLAVSMLLEYIRYRDYRKVAGTIRTFFEGMGSSFATVISLIIAASVLATGLIQIGAIQTLVVAADSAGFGPHLMVLSSQSLVALSAFVTGSSDATVFSFGPLVPQLAQHLHIDSVRMLLPMQFTGSILRSVSPVSAVSIAVAGIAGISPLEVSRRTAIPMAGALLVTTALNLVFL